MSASLTDTQQYILSNLSEIMDRWVDGASFTKIADQMFIPYPTLSRMLQSNPVVATAYKDAKMLKAQSLVDRAEGLASVAGDAGEKMLDNALMKTGIDTAMKIAGKLDPNSWGDKAHVDMHLAGEVTYDMRISPLEAYQSLLKGGVIRENDAT